MIRRDDLVRCQHKEKISLVEHQTGVVGERRDLPDSWPNQVLIIMGPAAPV